MTSTLVLAGAAIAVFLLGYQSGEANGNVEAYEQELGINQDDE